ncbi:MAG: Glu/Leu/Phe/Val dehydrogenase [Gammaproteobacteria bacterium]|uniref:Leu/Phe/Val dehydrogenase n=1 Tax=Pseudomaricurvus alcaniphilus TaxID=1166482 RepID=UPI00140BAF36|nr:Glu/Leu/Phe/Val dehydrogenase [Pseudomaricurvus alcaniphilus]MBR9912899.1 Glu/Leu/Phe/Val dehydrogenase [Gammaproteobacteria bacterium]NHN38693.1 Glu/Leu/Phe/Val dehydrogenase [Pseudomaricurvus alcaniphilus]
MSVFEHRSFDDHERVAFCQDKASGLRAIVAIHNTRLGHALGGCRMFPYRNSYEALDDVLRLSRGMTYKAALANLPLGGGKSVIIGDPRQHKSEALLQAMGCFIDSFNGAYVVAEDSGINEQDVRVMATRTAHVAGVGGDGGVRQHGDPSPATAHGVLAGISYAARSCLGRTDLEGLRVAIQGLGNVGYELARQLRARGAQLWVADTVPERVQQAISELGATGVGVADIFSQPVDVVAPCALGAVIDDLALNQLRARVIAGSANNQLAYDDLGKALQARGICYLPDYVINAGGLMEVHFQRQGISREDSYRRIGSQIEATLAQIIERATARGEASNQVADELARQRLEGKQQPVGNAA